jgi:hypothetical protein
MTSTLRGFAMPSTTRALRRNLGFALLASAITMSTGCEESPTEDDGEPRVTFIQVLVGGQSTFVEIDNRTGIQVGTLTLRQNQANALTVRFQDEGGGPEQIIASNHDDFELRAAALLPGVTFAATGGAGAEFSATITPTSIGQGSFRIVLFHRSDAHELLSRAVAYSVTP